MNSFFDTSSLVKLYDYREVDSATMQQLIDPQGVIYLSTLTQVEFASVLSRKRNRGDLNAAAQALPLQFEADTQAYGWVEQTPALRQLAVQLIQKYNSLRALDAIQLASALAVRADIQAFFTHDQRLREAAAAEGLPVHQAPTLPPTRPLSGP